VKFRLIGTSKYVFEYLEILATTIEYRMPSGWWLIELLGRRN